MESEQTESQVANDSYQVKTYRSGLLPDNYRNMVYSKWMRRLRHGNDYFKLIDSKSYYSAYEKYITHILGHSGCVIRLAVLSADPDTVLGFSVMEGETLHFVITFTDYRRMGIARSLIPVEVKTITHITKMGLDLWNTKLPEAIFNPFYNEG